MIGAFCNFHVNSKQRETNGVGEKRCVTTLITAAKETTSYHQPRMLAMLVIALILLIYQRTDHVNKAVD